MDSLTIQGLSVQTQIGVYAWEQQIKQQLLIDMVIPSNFLHCGDDLSQTIDYDALCKTVTSYVEAQSFFLIEYVAHCVAELVKEKFNVKNITVSVTKPHAIKNASVIKVSVTR